MGKFCKKCGKIMQNPEHTHCSDECLLSDIKSSKPTEADSKGAESWDEETDPWN